MSDTARQYGDVVPLRFGPLHALLLNDPAAIESVLVEHHRSFRKARGVRRLRTLLGDGIVTSEGEFWLRERRLMQPAFHRASVARYADVMVGRTTAALDRWQAGDTIELIPEMRRLTLEIAVEALFGREVTEQEARRVGASLDVASAQLQTRVSSLLTFVPDWVPTPGNRRMNAAISAVDEFVYRIIDERRRSVDEREDLLALLLAEAEKQGSSMSDRQLRDEVITLMVAGHETTAFTMTWALYLLARHTAADASLAAELAEVFEDGRAPSHDDLARLPYTANVVSETLRLYPAGYVTAREAVEEVAVNGYRIRKGTVVLMSQWVRHRDPRSFDEPDAFMPGRWADGLEKGLQRGEFFPFGMGSRQCIGASFANLELILALATMRRRFRFEPTSAEEARPVPIVTLQPDRPIRLRLAAPG